MFPYCDIICGHQSHVKVLRRAPAFSLFKSRIKNVNVFLSKSLYEYTESEVVFHITLLFLYRVKQDTSQVIIEKNTRYYKIWNVNTKNDILQLAKDNSKLLTYPLRDLVVIDLDDTLLNDRVHCSDDVGIFIQRLSQTGFDCVLWTFGTFGHLARNLKPTVIKQFKLILTRDRDIDEAKGKLLVHLLQLMNKYGYYIGGTTFSVLIDDTYSNFKGYDCMFKVKEILDGESLNDIADTIIKTRAEHCKIGQIT